MNIYIKTIPLVISTLIGIAYLGFPLLMFFILFDVISSSFYFFILETNFLINASEDNIVFWKFILIIIPLFILLSLFASAWINQFESFAKILKNKNLLLNLSNENDLELNKKAKIRSTVDAIRSILKKSEKLHIKFICSLHTLILVFFIFAFQTCTCITAFLFYSGFEKFNKIFFIPSYKLMIVSLLIDYVVITFFSIKGMLCTIDKILDHFLTRRKEKESRPDI